MDGTFDTKQHIKVLSHKIIPVLYPLEDEIMINIAN
jgi:hypothetical protein